MLIKQSDGPFVIVKCEYGRKCWLCKTAWIPSDDPRPPSVYHSLNKALRRIAELGVMARNVRIEQWKGRKQ